MDGKIRNWKKTVRRISIAVVVLLVLGVAVFNLLYAGPRPVCHRVLDCGFVQWVEEIGKTNAYPNVRGEAAASLADMKRFWGAYEIPKAYGYVPGLRFDDSNSLVLMYMKERTSYTWHADHQHNIFSQRKWMVLSPEFSGHCPEGGELLDTPEFKKRLLATIDFLKTNNRPNWEVVAREQTAFVASLK